jgi:Protein of unknown function (DUF3467)
MTDQNPSPVPVQFGNLRSPQWRAFFSNGFQFSFTPVDFSITFQAPVPVASTVVTPQDEATVYLTLASLKQLKDHLVAIVETYEKVNGPIKVVASTQPNPANLGALEKILRDNPIT